MAVERLKRCENIVALSEELGVHRRLLYKWRDQLDPVDIGDEPLPENPRESTLRKEVSQLKRLLAEKTVELTGSGCYKVLFSITYGTPNLVVAPV